MDFSRFSDDNFEAKQWVNAALKRKDDKIEIDAHASGLVMKLQLFIQEVNNALEETSAQSLNNMPRVLRELEVIQQEATLLKEQMKLVKDDIKAVEQNTSESMKMLLDLDEVKSRIQSASYALQEADNWATLSSDVDQVFQSGDHKQIAEKLVGMGRSLLVLQDVPDYHERHKLLENLKNKLEALLSPKLVSAFNSHSLEESQEYFQIFSDIDRLEQLQNYYIRCHKTKLLESWRSLLTADQSETMLHWLSMFYNGLLSTWHSEMTWCGQVFNRPASILCLLISQTLTHLDPPFSVCLKEYIKDDHYPIKQLIDLKQVTLRFSKALQSSVANVKEENCIKAVHTLVQTMVSPYIPYLLNYASLLTGYLTEDLKSIPMKTDGFLEITDMLAESVGKVFQLTDHAVESCILLTDGLGFYQLVNSLEIFFGKYLDKMSDIVDNIRNNLKLDDETSELDESMFQHASKLIQVCGSLLLKTEEFESSLVEIVHKTCGRWIGFEKKRNISPAEIFDTFNYLKNNNQIEFETFVEFVETVENGGGILTQVIKHIEELNNEIHNLTFDIAFSPLKQQMSSVPKLEIWSKHTSDTGDSLSGDIPSFSLSPLGYITEVGDYLLTLPHQLELFMVQDNAALETALKAGKLQFRQDVGTDDHNAAFDWLSSVTRATLHIYVENILRIPKLTSLANKQLIADIDYLFNILEALEVKPTELIVNINKLLKAEADEFHILAADLCVEQRIINALHAMKSTK